MTEVQYIMHIDNCLKNGDIDNARKAIYVGICLYPKSYEIWVQMGQLYQLDNVNKAYLCYENALFYCDNPEDQILISEMMEYVKSNEAFKVVKTAIVILSYNSLELTKQCVESIRRTCSDSMYEIVIIDNASQDGSVEWIMAQPDIKYQINTDNVGFPAGCNQGIGLAEQNSDILLLNNDTVLANNSLFWLRMGLYENDEVGSTGAITNNCSNGQDIRLEYTTKEDILNWANVRGYNYDNSYVEKIYLVGYAALYKRKVLEEVGYLDEIFTPGNYEDADLGIRIFQAGYRQLLCMNSFIYHYGHGGESLNTRWKAVIEKNKAKINSKWGFEVNENLYTMFDFQLLPQDGRSREILVVGCRLGAIVNWIRHKMPDSNVTGIDCDDYLEPLLENRADLYWVDSFERDNPFENKRFDIIILNKQDEGLESIWAKYLNEEGYFIRWHTY